MRFLYASKAPWRHAMLSKAELPQEFVAGENAVEGRFRFVVFDEVVPHARFFRLREDAPPVNRAAADFGHLMILGHVLDVHEREAAGIAVKIDKRVLSPFGDPAKIHFHLHELRIGLREKDIVRQLAAERLVFDKFEGMVVIAELDARLLAGIQFGYHNHTFEFVKDQALGGKLPYDVLLAETDPKLVQMEMDLCWITEGGQDPLVYFDRYPGRFPLVHVKDMTKDHQMTEVGSGAIDWRRIFAQSEKAGMRHYFVEHDEPKAPFDSILTSYEFLRKLRF